MQNSRPFESNYSKVSDSRSNYAEFLLLERRFPEELSFNRGLLDNNDLLDQRAL